MPSIQRDHADVDREGSCGNDQSDSVQGGTIVKVLEMALLANARSEAPVKVAVVACQ